MPDKNAHSQKPYEMEIRVTTRSRPGLIWMAIEAAIGLAILAVICVTLLTGIGAVIINLNTTGNLPQPIVDISTGFYHHFF